MTDQPSQRNDVRTVRSYGPDNIYIDGLTKGPSAGWSWDGTALSHPLRIRLRVTPAAAERVSAAVAAYVPGTGERKTGYQVSQLPESERAGWEWDSSRWGKDEQDNEPGWYVRHTPSVAGVCEITADEIVEIAKG